MKLLLADDHSIIRKGLKLHLKMLIPNFEIDEASSCSQLMQMVRSKAYTHLIVDIMFSDGSSLEILPNIVSLYPNLKIMIYSMQAKAAFQKVMKQNNIYFYAEKSLEEQDLDKVLQSFFNDYDHTVKKLKQQKLNSPVSSLSQREMEILHYMLKGEGTKEIAEALNLKMNSVSTFKQRIAEKTETKNIKELMDWAAANGINF